MQPSAMISLVEEVLPTTVAPRTGGGHGPHDQHGEARSPAAWRGGPGLLALAAEYDETGLERDEAIAPSIWPLEIANRPRTPERRGRLDLADLPPVRELLVSLPVQVEGVELRPGAAADDVTVIGRPLARARTARSFRDGRAAADVAARRGSNPWQASGRP